ncbi:MAG TPA: hypothetical protein VGL56_04265 [Fimbriimonadaceae bacterium]|jgi:hypothetical protein
MSVTAISSATSGSATSAKNSNPAVTSDVEVRTLKSQIQDWSTCPTTDPATKKAIVGRLTTKLDTLENTLETKAQQQAKDKQDQSHSAASQTGLGNHLDISI